MKVLAAARRAFDTVPIYRRLYGDGAAQPRPTVKAAAAKKPTPSAAKKKAPVKKAPVKKKAPAKKKRG
jgi:hypothetical protein